MSDTGEKSSFEGSSKRSLEEDEEQVAPVTSTKRPRGPYDCLDWSDSDDEPFTPFTQSNPSPPKIFAKKSKAKNVGSKKSSKGKGVSKKSVAKNSSNKDGSVVSKLKGKSLGNYLLLRNMVFLLSLIVIFTFLSTRLLIVVIFVFFSCSEVR